VFLNEDPYADEARVARPKNLISAATYAKLEKFVCHFNHEGVFKQWVDMPLLLQNATNLNHLELVRKLKFRTLNAPRATDRFKAFPNSNYNPLYYLRPTIDARGEICTGEPVVERLAHLVVKNYFCMHFIKSLVKANTKLKTLNLKRRNYSQDLFLSDTLYLKELNVTLDSAKATLCLGQNLSLTNIRANCKIDLAAKLHRLQSLEYVEGYRPSQIEANNVLNHSVALSSVTASGITLESEEEF